MTNPPDIEKLAKRLLALAFDCENTDGWEDAAPDVRAAAQALQSARAQAFEEAARVADAYLCCTFSGDLKIVADMATKQIAKCIRTLALTTPEDQVTSETERSMLVRDSFDPDGDNDGGELLVYPGPADPVDLAERVYDALPLNSAYKPYYSLSSVRLILETAQRLSTALPERDEVVEELRDSVGQELEAARTDLIEGLTADLPQTDTGWMLRERFDEAKLAVERALSKLKPSREGGEG